MKDRHKDCDQSPHPPPTRFTTDSLKREGMHQCTSARVLPGRVPGTGCTWYGSGTGYQVNTKIQYKTLDPSRELLLCYGWGTVALVYPIGCRYTRTVHKSSAYLVHTAPGCSLLCHSAHTQYILRNRPLRTRTPPRRRARACMQPLGRQSKGLFNRASPIGTRKPRANALLASDKYLTLPEEQRKICFYRTFKGRAHSTHRNTR